MKKIMIAAALLIGMLSITEVNAQGRYGTAPVGKEQIKQHQRIQQGKHTGQLNRREAQQLQIQQRHIQQMKQLAKADGRVTRKERAIIEAEQQRASAHIYRNKHDRNRN